MEFSPNIYLTDAGFSDRMVKFEAACLWVPTRAKKRYDIKKGQSNSTNEPRTARRENVNENRTALMSNSKKGGV
jgi:hypothetical protein